MTKTVVDSVHGDIHLTDREVAVIDTGAFQRLRHLKQLQMSQVTYPNATHTRFAHSLGVLAVMSRVLLVAGRKLRLTRAEEKNLRLAALLHDIGHYPYSHLMENLDAVRLTEEEIEAGGRGRRSIDASKAQYPRHEALGLEIVTHQKELCEAIGGREQARKVADIFTRAETANQQMSKLIHSSLDMDRLDYLLRDSHAVGAPFGRIDINYLLNNLEISGQGVLGVREKALAAAEHFLLARFFMYRTVYYHKTTWGLQEACGQMLRRLQDEGELGVPRDGQAVLDIVRSDRLFTFTDAYIDAIVQRATDHRNPVVSALARAIRSRKPPKLLKEVCVFGRRGETGHDGALFMKDCRHKLRDLAKSVGIPIGQFLLCSLKPLGLEERGPHLTREQAEALPSRDREELIKVFCGEEKEPRPIVDVKHSLLQVWSDHSFQMFRLYVVYDGEKRERKIQRLLGKVAPWGSAG